MDTLDTTPQPAVKPISAIAGDKTLRSFFMQAPTAIAILEGPEHTYTFANPLYQQLYSRTETELLGRTVREVFPELAGQGIYELLDAVFASGEAFTAKEFSATIGAGSEAKTGYYDVTIQPVRDDSGALTHLMAQIVEVTGQVLAKQQLAEREAGWEELANAMPQLVWIADAAGEVTYYNRRVHTYAGAHQDDTGHWRWAGLLHHEDVDATAAAWESAVQAGIVYSIEHRIQMADGSYRWHLSRAYKQSADDGKAAKWFGTATDIHERKNAEANAAKAYETTYRQQRLYETVTDNTPDLIYIFDLNYRFTYANKALLEMWGKSWDEAIGKGLLDNGYEPWHAEMHHREIDQIIATRQPVRGTVSFPHATLGKRIYDYILSPVINEAGEVEAVAGTTRDISDASAFEGALRESEVRFRLLAEDAPMWVWKTDEHANIEFANGELLSFLGFRHYSEFTGQIWQQIVHPDDIAPVQAAFAHAAEANEPYSVECRHRNHQTGDFEWFLIRGTPRLEAGIFKGFIGTAINIQRQKELTENLESQIAARTTELLRSNADLQQFAHVASHDLKEPLRKIRTFSGLLEKGLGDGISPDARFYIGKINSATARMVDMVEGVLAYSTINAGQQAAQLIDLTETIRNIEADAEVSIAQKGATITCEALPAIEGAPVLIYQLFYNLINNSLKFAKGDEPLRIAISGEVLEEYRMPLAVIRVQDNGIGFEQEHAVQIFETFSRLNSKDRYEGTGLGLSLCKKIAERHGGSIRAESSPGHGATFIITLPMRQSADNV